MFSLNLIFILSVLQKCGQVSWVCVLIVGLDTGR